jgi:hypothetical protein
VISRSRSSIFWDVTRHLLVVNCPLFGQLICPILKCQTLLLGTPKMGSKGCPETSVTNHQSTLHNISEERMS